MSAGDLPCLSTIARQDVLRLSVLVREFRLVRVPCFSPSTCCAGGSSNASWPDRNTRRASGGRAANGLAGTTAPVTPPGVPSADRSWAMVLIM